MRPPFGVRTSAALLFTALVMMLNRSFSDPSTLTAAPPPAASVSPQPNPTGGSTPPVFHPPAIQRLTLDEAKERVVANSKLLTLAALNVEGKGYATKAMRAQYFPQVIGSSVYFHFNDELGQVLTTPGRTLTGPLGRVSLGIPATSVDVPVLNQDSEFTTVAAVQPITALLKVRQGVKAAVADEQIAQAQLDKGRRELLSGTEQLFWGLLSVQRIRAGAAQAVGGAEMLAKTPGAPVEVRLALAEGRQALQKVEAQLADLQEQMNLLLDQPPCTVLELVEPAFPVATVKCADEAVSLALACSPEIREAEQNVVKAQAGLAANKVDYLPSIAIVGGYANQTGASYVQQDIGYLGVTGSYTFFDWGKRRNTIRGSENLIALANLKVQTTEDEVRQKTLKAFRVYQESHAAIYAAQEMVQLRKEVVKIATTPEALTNPGPLLEASKKSMEAEIDFIKADLAYRIAYVELMALICNH
jgi:outer membrane protein TolC